jgi:hypothetical protein
MKYVELPRSLVLSESTKGVLSRAPLPLYSNPSSRTIVGHETGAPRSQTLYRRGVDNDIISVCLSNLSIMVG